MLNMLLLFTCSEPRASMVHYEDSSMPQLVVIWHSIRLTHWMIDFSV